MDISTIIEKARSYQFVDDDGSVNLGSLIEQQRKAIEAADRFFREAMPHMNVKNSALDANAVDAWNKAEVAIAKAMRP